LAIDKAGNLGSAGFSVTVSDPTPSLHLPDGPTAQATSAAGAVVTYAASATDIVDSTDPVTCTPASGSMFQIGPSTVSCTATNKAGMNTTGSFTLTVTAPPANTGNSSGGGSGGGGGVDNGNNGGTTGDTTSGAAPVTDPGAPNTAPDVVSSTIKQTAPRKPPPPPPPAPPRYGVIQQVHTIKIRNGLHVQFVFKTLPQHGARLQTTWYYNNKALGKAIKKLAATVATSVSSSSQLPAGYWRCTLSVKLPSGTWHRLHDATVRLH
jgi:hypothetical protein